MRISRRSYLVLTAGVLALCLAVYGGVQIAGNSAVTLPPGTQLRVSLDLSVSSSQNRSGDGFDATVIEPVVLKDKMVIPAGARAHGELVEARESGRLEGVASLRLKLTEVEVGGKTYDVETNTLSRRGPNHKRNNWAWIGGGAAGGMVIGAIAGGGKGALIGGPVGAGAGLAAAAITGKRNIRLSAERNLVFTLTEPAMIKPAKS